MNSTGLVKHHGSMPCALKGIALSTSTSMSRITQFCMEDNSKRLAADCHGADPQQGRCEAAAAALPSAFAAPIMLFRNACAVT